jgi:hypothetical protein
MKPTRVFRVLQGRLQSSCGRISSGLDLRNHSALAKTLLVSDQRGFLTSTRWFSSSSDDEEYDQPPSSDKDPPTRDGTHTPAMKQYLKMKESVPGYLLLFQMGDFFEIFYEDAIKAAKLLDITLTVRDKTNNSQ